MPRAYRWKLKRQLDHATEHLNKANLWLVEVGHQYKDLHPDYYESFCELVALIDILKDKIKEIRDKI